MLLHPHVTVRTAKKKGRGVFATKEIAGGSVIGDYIGIVTKSDEGDEEYEDDAVYDMWYSDKVDICPDPDEDGVHMINHSCEPNCAMAALGRRTIIFALRTIFPREELTYDYFLGDQDTDCQPGTDNCHCGSPFCRGTMYSNPKAYEEWDAFLEERIGNASEDPPVPYGERLPMMDEYPSTIDDHPIYPLFGSRMRLPVECPPEALASLPEIRKRIRCTGRQQRIPNLDIVIEGILFGGHLVLAPPQSSGQPSTTNRSKRAVRSRRVASVGSS